MGGDISVPRPRSWALEQYFNALYTYNVMRLFKPRQQITLAQWQRVPEWMRRKIMALDYVKIAPLGVLLTLQGLEVLAYTEATG